MELVWFVAHTGDFGRLPFTVNSWLLYMDDIMVLVILQIGGLLNPPICARKQMT